MLYMFDHFCTCLSQNRGMPKNRQDVGEKGKIVTYQGDFGYQILENTYMYQSVFVLIQSD